MPLRSWLVRNWIVLALPVGGLLLLRTYHTPPFNHQRARFTLGTIEQPPGDEPSQTAAFAFTVGRAAYNGTSRFAAQPGRAGRRTRCLVEYDSLDPQQNVGYLSVAIPDSLTQPPANGWRVPPFPVPHWILDLGKEVR